MALSGLGTLLDLEDYAKSAIVELEREGKEWWLVFR